MTDTKVTFDGPDDDGFIWVHVVEANGESRSVNLGKSAETVEEAMSQWLGSRDYQERG